MPKKGANLGAYSLPSAMMESMVKVNRIGSCGHKLALVEHYLLDSQSCRVISVTAEDMI